MYTCTCIPTGIPVQVCIHAPPVLPVSIWNKEEIHDCDLIKCGLAVKVGLYTIGGLDWWTGLVDWTTGLIRFAVANCPRYIFPAKISGVVAALEGLPVAIFTVTATKVQFRQNYAP